MATHYQVIAEFSFIRRKLSLFALSLRSTSTACASLPFSLPEREKFNISRIFHTLQEARSYIEYLRGVYAHCDVPFPPLDGGQIKLF
ncbi:MAG TPA: hypothetical protein DEQ14_06310 [Treponema sp.]|nr:hypothetical protein [Treponema sp.]